MKKFTFLIRDFFFLFLICSLITSKVFSQKIKPEIFNFTELSRQEATETYRQHFDEEIDGGWRYLQSDRPFPPGAKIKRQSPALITSPNNIEAASPSPLQGFLGYIDPLQSIPPDCHGAVGINNVVTATNDFIIVHAKNGGAELSKVTFATFFNHAGMSDPYMQFDPYLKRYWVSGISTENTNKVYLAVSQTSDPAGSWYRYSFTPTSADGALLLDHPYLGFDNRILVITGRKFPDAASFTGPILFCFDKASLAAGNAIDFGTNAQTIEKTTADGDVPCPVTALDLTTPAPEFYIVQNWSGGSSAIRLSTITGSIPTLSWNTASAFYPSGGSPWSGAQLGNLAPQLDETRKLAVNDARISSAQLVNGKIWCAHHIGLPATNFNHTAVQWWQLSAAGDVLQRGRIDDPAGLISRYYPTITVNPAENVLIGYTISSPTTRVNAAYSTRTASTPLNTTDDEYVFKGGISTYWKDYGTGRARWGDYSHSVVDPVDGDLWTIQQYAEQRASAADNDSKYGVWWAEVSFITFNNDAALSDIIEPNGAAPYCAIPVSPSVTVKNVGKDTLKSIKVGLILDGVNVGTNSFTGLNLSLYNSQNLPINLPLSPSPGDHILQAYTLEPNGKTDERTSNDTTSITFSILQELPLPHTEGFESTVFPPPGGWSLFNPDGDITWARTTVASKSGNASMFLDVFDYTTVGAIDILKSPKISLKNVDSINIRFDVAYAQYSAGYSDSLEILYSTDCGVTWHSTSYKKGGRGLSTTGGTYSSDAFVPNASQWRTENVGIATCDINSSSILIGIKSINDFGNNIYIDNFSISKVDIKQANAAVVSINKPFGTLCSPDFTPEVTIANYGYDTLKTLKINYQVDNGSVETFAYTGALPRCQIQVISLNSISASPGDHVLTVFSTEPNGIADMATSNDTVKKTVSISPILDAPLTEGFETTTFPPTNWSIQNPDGLLTWERTTSTAKTGTGSMVIRNYDYPSANTIDKFFSPVIRYSAEVDSFFVSFDYAYAPGALYPGSTNLPLDTLEVQLTQDCGQTFTTIWKKWGEDLQTINDPNRPNGSIFTPNSPSQWKNINLYISPVITDKNFQVYFVAKSNKQNNVYIDNINIYTKILPKRLKDQGYLIYPSPFTSSFVIHNYRVPTTLQSIGIYNSIGQLVWAKDVNGTANTEMTVNLSKLAAGIYIVKLRYLEKTVVERIVKQ